MANFYSQLGGIFTGGKPKEINNEKLMNSLIIEIKGYLQNIRNGNYYSQIDPLAIIANPKLLKQPNQ
jgi:hypothetical protein